MTPSKHFWLHIWLQHQSETFWGLFWPPSLFVGPLFLLKRPVPTIVEQGLYLFQPFQNRAIKRIKTPSSPLVPSQDDWKHKLQPPHSLHQPGHSPERRGRNVQFIRSCKWRILSSGAGLWQVYLSNKKIKIHSRQLNWISLQHPEFNYCSLTPVEG